MFILSKMEKINKKINSNIIINQQTSFPTPASKTKAKDQKRVDPARRGWENYMKKLKERLLKDNQEARMTLKELIDYFQQNLNDPASMLMAIEETMRFMKEEHNTERNISIRGADHAENVWSKTQQEAYTNRPHYIKRFRIWWQR